MSVSAADKIMLCVGLVGFGGLFVFLGAALYLAYTKMDLMLDHLKNCPAITIRAFLIDTGPWGRLMVLGAITGLMITPKIYLRDGGASAEDLQNFPVGLKYKLITVYWIGLTFILVLLGVFAVDELGLV